MILDGGVQISSYPVSQVPSCRIVAIGLKEQNTSMYRREVTVSADDGLHIRPATELVKMAKKFSSDIAITSSGRTANAKSLFKLQSLELQKGAILTVSADGDDEILAVESLVRMIAELA